jgi:hypothetical protein
MTPEEIQMAKKSNHSNHKLYNMFISYCHSKQIGIYSAEAYSEILKLFPKDENPKLYEYCIWMFKNQIDF